MLYQANPNEHLAPVLFSHLLPSKLRHTVLCTWASMSVGEIMSTRALAQFQGQTWNNGTFLSYRFWRGICKWVLLTDKEQWQVYRVSRHPWCRNPGNFTLDSGPQLLARVLGSLFKLPSPVNAQKAFMTTVLVHLIGNHCLSLPEHENHTPFSFDSSIAQHSQGIISRLLPSIKSVPRCPFSGRF